MQGSSPSFLDLQKPKDSSWFFITIFVIACHCVCVWIGMSLANQPLPKQARGKVVVKTIQLTPSLQPVSIALEAPAPFIPPAPALVQEIEKDLLQEKTSLPPPLPLLIEEPLTVLPPQKLPSSPLIDEVKEPVLPKEEKEPILSTPPPPPIASPLPKTQEKKMIEKPATQKVIKPAPKTTVPEPKKVTPAKKPITPAPIKKPLEQTGKTPDKTESNKAAAAAEAEKKRQQAEIKAKEEIEKQRQQKIAEEQTRLREEKLSKARENIAKLGETSNKFKSTSSIKLENTSIPKPIENLQIDTFLAEETGSIGLGATSETYEDAIDRRLRSALRLPDYGAVKIKLILNKLGIVQDVVIVSSESQKNKQYIERSLPTIRSLHFPAFGNSFNGAPQYTFLITLNNDH